MRELKFRMIKVRITYQHEDTGRFTTRFVIFGQGVPHLGERWFVIGQDEYTGLKDKNGKEIYEGDIIRGKRLDYYDYSPELQEKVVEWDDAGAWWPFANADDEAPYPKPNEVEVIGNIYENPELLEER